MKEISTSYGILQNAKWPALVLASSAVAWSVGRLSATGDTLAGGPATAPPMAASREDLRTVESDLAHLRAHVEQMRSPAPGRGPPPDAGDRRRLDDERFPFDSMEVARQLDDRIAAGPADRSHATEIADAAREAVRDVALPGAVQVSDVTCGSGSCRVTLRHADVVGAGVMSRLHSRGPFRAEMFTVEAPLIDGSAGTRVYLARPGHRLFEE